MKNLSTAVMIVLSILFYNLTNNVDRKQETPVEPIKLADNLYRIDTGPVSSLVLTGEDGILIVDTSFDETGENIKTGLEKLSAGDIRYIINTHWHHDHCRGNIALGENTVIISHDNAKTLLSAPQRLDFFNEDHDALPEHARPNLTFSDKMYLHFNDEDIQLIYFPPGHSDSDIIAFFKNANVIHIGDMIFSDMFPFIDFENGGNIEQLAENLMAIIEMMPEDVVIVPGHGRNYSIKDLREYRKMLISTYDIISREMEKGCTLEEMQEAEILKDFTKWENGNYPCDNWIRTVHYYITNKGK